jgi:hypothetical protein
MVHFPEYTKTFFLLQQIQTGSEACQASYSVGTKSFFPVVKQLM